jgi:hypothetical protein
MVGLSIALPIESARFFSALRAEPKMFLDQSIYKFNELTFG